MVSKIKWDIPLHTGSLTPFPVRQAAMQDGRSPSSWAPLLGNTHGPCTIICGGCSGRQLQVKPPWGTPVSALRRHSHPVTCEKSPHHRRTQTTETQRTALRIAQAKLVTSPYQVLPQHSSLHKRQQGTGKEIQVFWHFCLYFLLKLLFTRANVSTVSQFASTTPCRGRRKRRIPFGGEKKKICDTSLVSQVTRAAVKAHTHNPTLVKLLLYLIMAGTCSWLPSTKTTRWKSQETEASPGTNLTKRCKSKAIGIGFWNTFFYRSIL